MKKYIGVKMIEAEPMTDIEVEEKKGHPICIGREDKKGYKVTYEDGYISWCPKDVFEKAYRRIDNMTFGLAIEALKKGNAVCRKGWNGKNMWLVLVKPSDYTVDCVRSGNCEICHWIGMKTADDKFIPWLASQADLLAEDWNIIEFDRKGLK
jgi:hypothetical protein